MFPWLLLALSVCARPGTGASLAVPADDVPRDVTPDVPRDVTPDDVPRDVPPDVTPDVPSDDVPPRHMDTVVSILSLLESSSRGGSPEILGKDPEILGIDPGVSPGFSGKIPGVSPGILGSDPGVSPGFSGKAPGVSPGILGKAPGVSPGFSGKIPGVSPWFLGWGLGVCSSPICRAVLGAPPAPLPDCPRAVPSPRCRLLSELLRPPTPERGVVLAPDGSSVAIAPLLAGIEAGLRAAGFGRPLPTPEWPLDPVLAVTVAEALGTSFLLARRGGDKGDNATAGAMGTGGCWDSVDNPQNYTPSSPRATVPEAVAIGAMDGAILGTRLARGLLGVATDAEVARGPLEVATDQAVAQDHFPVATDAPLAQDPLPVATDAPLAQSPPSVATNRTLVARAPPSVATEVTDAPLAQDPLPVAMDAELARGPLPVATNRTLVARAPPSVAELLRGYYGPGGGSPGAGWRPPSSDRRREFRALAGPARLWREVAQVLVALRAMSPVPELVRDLGTQEVAEVARRAAREFSERYVECPLIVPRCLWGARPARGSPVTLLSPLSTLVIHHTLEPSRPCRTFGHCARDLRDIQRFHQDTRGWDDIGYNFLVGSDGSVFEGRGWHRVGAHARGHNSHSYGVAIVGDFRATTPDRDTVALVRDQLLPCAVRSGHLRPDFVLRGHRQLGHTDCPGDALFQEIRGWPGFGGH